ncbi:phosphoribosyl-AMP cyclohydrolase [Rickettsiales bacterium]|nr:phosphoribosyl-AMP cyclohydrolase [Rickettsiales bacterium]
MVSKEQVLQAQKHWGESIVKIGSLRDNRQKCENFTNKFLDETYAFDLGKVLFKPTKAAIFQFRADKESALSYFIGKNPNFTEDNGFAITPWKEVVFDDDFNIILEENRAIIMGNYYFTDMDNNKVKVEYTFGYRLHNGKLKIDLHHSSLPFSG